MASTTTVGRPTRLFLGWPTGPQPLGLLAIIFVWSLATAAAFLFRTFAGALPSVSLGVVMLVVGAKTRAYVDLDAEKVVMAPTGILGPKFSRALASLGTVEVLEGRKVVFVDLAGTKHSFGPWVNGWGHATGMRARCEHVVEVVRRGISRDQSTRTAVSLP